MFKLVVLLSAVALAAAAPSWLSPLALSSIHSPLAIAPLAAVAPAHLALSPHSPAVVLNAHGVPLDTTHVVAARALHLQAKALAGHGLHLLKKRSLVGPLGHSSAWPLSAPIISRHAAISPLVHSAPILHSVPLHSGIHAW